MKSGDKTSRDVSGLRRRAGMSRQNYYASRKRRERRTVDTDLILFLVAKERKVQPRVGTRKLLVLLKEDLKRHRVSIGGDRLFNVLREASMLVDEKKAFTPKTTNSKHTPPTFKNLLKRYELTGPNQGWVSDITYVKTEKGFTYAALITDAFSRKIVGAYIGDSLESTGAMKALDMAVNSLPKGRYPIHHSDRGCQYCCHKYVNELKRHGLSISMTEENHCYENAVAERVNGILKDEFHLDMEFRAKEDAYRAFWNAVHIYNNRRPHMNLDYAIPCEVHSSVA